MRRFAVAALVCAALALGVALRDLDCPGLYYDEVIQAEPALWFLHAEPAPPEVPGETHAQIFGRPFPLMTQPYMGALKSQLLVPVLALSPDARSLRAATLMVAVLGIVCAMAFARRAYDLPTAVLLGLLLAVDPSLLFIGRHDWGSFSLGFLLRSFALLALLSGWRKRSAAWLFAGGLAAGLGIYNKIDAAVPLLAAGAALLIAAPGWLRELRDRGAALVAAASGLVLGAMPVLLGVIPALRVTLAAARAGARLGNGQSEIAEKTSALLATLDGSYFERLMRAGGSFERLALQDGATATPFAALFLLACVALAIRIALDLRRGRPARGMRFALAVALLSLVGMLATPRAVRIHHFLNAWPFPHLVVAVAAMEAWRRFERGRAVARAGVALALAAALLGALRADRATLENVRATCGKGRWSDALARFAPALASKGAMAVALDWGFAGPLRFVAPDLQVQEPIWAMGIAPSTTLRGGAGQVYLVLEPEYAVFPYGPALLRAIAGLPPDAVHVHHHVDREGDTAFVSLRFAGPHALVYRGGHVEVQLQ